MWILVVVNLFVGLVACECVCCWETGGLNVLVAVDYCVCTHLFCLYSRVLLAILFVLF